MNLPTRGRFIFKRAELWADGTIHVLGVASGVAAAVALIVQVARAAPLSDLIPVSIYSASLLAVLI
ncbi:MAG: PAQR family membrane homeostasis protein TrhA, partial [Bosea sp. (in: a-proteobacteria)]